MTEPPMPGLDSRAAAQAALAAGLAAQAAGQAAEAVDRKSVV